MSEKWEGRFFFDPADKIYADHFPKNPIVPGSLIIYAFMQAAKKLGAVKSVKNFRFKKFIAPGTYDYTMELRENNCLKCKLFDQGRAVTTGDLKL